MTLACWRFDPGPCEFPRPRIPVLPPPTRDQLRWRARPLPQGLGLYARCRYALRAAFQACGVGPKGALLAPAYHCRTMLDPALELGAEIGLYALTEVLDPDPEGLALALRGCSTRPAALLFTHYFGLPRAIAPVAEWCRDEGIALIEDCSHALVWGPDLPPAPAPAMGRVGRFATSSPYKFLPCSDGGWLWSNSGAALPAEPTGRPSARDEMGALRDLLQPLLRRRRAPALASFDDEWARACSCGRPLGCDWIDESGALSDEYCVDEQHRAPLAVSRWLWPHVPMGPLLECRRRRWLQWADAVRPLAGCHALLPELPAGSTPYMFPLVVDDPPAVFYPLKHMGMPIQRWDDMAISDCPVSRRYRQGLFQIPCHQALSDDDMAWMVRAVQRAVGGSDR